MSTGETACRVRLIALVMRKFAVACQKVENVLELLFVVVSLDFFMFDRFAKCESGQADNRKWTLKFVRAFAFKLNTYMFSCLT